MTSLNDRILASIRSHKELGSGFSSETMLDDPDIPLLLEIVLSAHESLPSWDLETCRECVTKNLSLVIKLADAYTKKSFADLDDRLVRAVERSTKGLVTRSLEMGKSNSNESTSSSNKSNNSPLQTAFTMVYQGDGHRHFIRVLDSYLECNAYNRSISIIQSSGMGKSRLVREAADEVFAIPANLRESTKGTPVYPPSDDDLRSYLEDHEFKSDDLIQAEHAILLKHMFACAISTLSKKKLQGSKSWANYLDEGQNDQGVGNNRRDFYKDVLDAAKVDLDGISEEVWVDLWDLCIVPPPPQNLADPRLPKRFQLYFKLNRPALLDEQLAAMYLNAKNLVQVVQKFSSGKTACLVYFDEAHNLTVSCRIIPNLCSRNPYHNLGTVLSRLVNLPIFFTFLSTNSHINQFAPPPVHYPSARASKGTYLIPPFTELPYDIFMTKMFEWMRSSDMTRSLANACTTRVMSGMGRPMWFVHHEQWPPEEGTHPQFMHVLEFAKQKLTAQETEEHKQSAELAALSVRIGVTFESTTQASRWAEAQQVESHMRVVYAIPEHREYMRTGSPSEPVLAEAAARYLNQASSSTIATTAPRILSENCAKGFLARGERGELCGRLLMTIAHDLALNSNPKLRTSLVDSKVMYHIPVPVLTFLCALFKDTHHNTILNATPATDKEGQTLRAAFKDAYVCFSHFALAADSAMLDANALRTALFRGMAIQAKDNQVSIDAVIPIHMGPTTNPITTKTTSAINLQFKNRKVSQPCSVDRSITVPNPEQPVISIVLELGEELSRSKKLIPFVEAQHWDFRVTQSKGAESCPHQDDRHYLFVARGCGPETYNAIPEKGGYVYASILASGGLKDNFPRNGDEGSWEFVQELKPSFIAARCNVQWNEWNSLDPIPPGLSTTPSTNGNQKGTTVSSKARGRKTNEVTKSSTGQKAGPSKPGQSRKKRKSGAE